MDGHIMRCGTIGSCQSGATSEMSGPLPLQMPIAFCMISDINYSRMRERVDGCLVGVIVMECSPYCRGNCYTSQPSVVPCCDAECVGGCSGPLKSHCWVSLLLLLKQGSHWHDKRFTPRHVAIWRANEWRIRDSVRRDAWRCGSDE